MERRAPGVAGVARRRRSLLYLAMVLASAVRWGVLLRAQHVRLPFSFLTQSFLVATFFNNFLPSNIGGDVVRITDTAKAAGSKTLATTVVLIDRGLGLLGLALMAATGASLMQRMAVGPVGPAMLWAGFGARRDRRDAGPADAGNGRRGSCSRCGSSTRNGWTRGSRS